LRMAYAAGDVDKIAKYRQAVADRKAKIAANQIAAAQAGIDLGFKQSTLETERERTAIQGEQMRGTLAHYKDQIGIESKRLDQMIAHDADSASIQRQHLTLQEAQNKRTAAHQAVMEDLARSTKPTAAEKLDQQTQAKVNADKAYQAIVKKLENVELNSDEYYDILESARKVAITHYAKGMELPPPVQRESKPAKLKEEPGFFSRMFGSSPAPAPKVIKLD